MAKLNRDAGSFRDPSGFIFSRDGVLYRQVNLDYRQNYDNLMQTGLYQELVDNKKIIFHEQVDIAPLQKESAYIVIRPTRLPFISYPYEWCFSQYKSAAPIAAFLDIPGFQLVRSSLISRRLQPDNTAREIAFKAKRIHIFPIYWKFGSISI